MQLKETGGEILNQLVELTRQLSDEAYSAELDLLNGNTIGKHVRHVVEFFDILVSGAGEGLINYDKRKHEPLYEIDTDAAHSKLMYLIEKLEDLGSKESLILELSYSGQGEETVKISTSLERELAYNIEHAIHHMAIIKIAIKTVFPNTVLPQNFGIAYSTIRYQKSKFKQPRT